MRDLQYANSFLPSFSSGGGLYSLEQVTKQKIEEMVQVEKRLTKSPKSEKSRLALFTSCVNALEAHFQFIRRRFILSSFGILFHLFTVKK